jgi:DNA invertase Pin-like site-specific DNA recombinase
MSTAPARPYRTNPDLVRELSAEGLKDAAIAERIGVSSRTVLRIRKQLGLSAANPRTSWRATPEWKEEVQRLLDEGWSVAEIIRHTGNTHCTIKRHFPDAGWDPQTSGSYALSIAKANRELRRLGQEPLPPAKHVH